MTTENADLFYKAFMVEATTKTLILKGITDWEELIERIDVIYKPTTSEEIEVFSEAIIYARCAVLN